jgi:hypothetical protein
MYDNVCLSMSYFLKHYHGLNNFKKGQLDSNREAVFVALKFLESAQVKQIYDYLRKENEKKAQALYESGKITKAEKKEFIKEKTLSKRTIHRHLDFLVEKCLIGHFDHKYSIIDTPKRNTEYWSHEFGVSTLDALMRCYFPHVLKFGENIEQLINIFGIYTVYCLAKATQPPVNESDGHKNNVDRDSLVLSWVNDVFDPQRMLEYFVAIMVSLMPDVKVESIRNNTFVKGHPKYPSWLDKIKKIDSPPSAKHIKWRDGDGHDFSPEDACVIRAKRFGKLLLSKAMSEDITEKSNFVLVVDIPQIIRVLEKKYHTYYEGVDQSSQSSDIVELTNKKQTEWEKGFLLSTDEMVNNIRWWL